MLITAGCIGGNAPTTTTTAEPTVTATGTVTAEPTTTTTPDTTTAEPTTTAAPKPDPTVTVRNVPDTVRDGTATVEVRIENHGGAGDIPWNLQLDRAHGDYYDTAWNGSAYVEANEVITRTVTIDFRATGEYQLLIDGHTVGTLEVKSLGHTGGGGSNDAEPAPPVIDVSVSGESVVG